jgi:hypothetical protein
VGDVVLDALAGAEDVTEEVGNCVDVATRDVVELLELVADADAVKVLLGAGMGLVHKP